MSTEELRRAALNTPIGGHLVVGTGPDARRVNRGGTEPEAFAERVISVANRGRR